MRQTLRPLARLCRLATAVFALAWFVGIPGAVAQEAGRTSFKYIGAGSCSATACHGGVQPKTITSVQQNEYSIWVVQDSHAKAYRSLQNPVSLRMGKILGIGKPESAPKCLACHALAIPAAQKGRDFDIGDGVSCESCHGPASGWLGPHTTKDFPRARSVALGMYDTSDLLRRSEKCLTCHLGTKDKEVDHQMIAAGHPDLVFELDSYSAIMPPHWKPVADTNYGVKTWGVDQAVKLREALNRLGRRVRGPVWPEYSELDCFSCHHSLTKPENSWRQERGYPNRMPGAPPWNAAHYAVFRVLAKDVNPDASQRLEKELADIYRLTTQPAAPRNQIEESAKRGADLAGQLASQINGTNFDRARTARLLAQITANADDISDEDTRTAEQAAMALDALYISYSKEGGKNPAVRAAIDGLFQQLENPSAYNGPRFKAQMQRVGAALREAGIAR
jgi:Cytochrome c554 and c-prime